MRESIELSSASVETAAKIVADRKAGHAKIWFGVAAVFALALVAMQFDDPERVGVMYTPGEAIVGGLFWVGLFSAIGIVVQRRATRARAVALRAAGDPALRWFRNHDVVVASDAHGAPDPALTFAIHRRLRAMLTAVPTARATFTAEK